jgi:HNH endonuclease
MAESRGGVYIESACGFCGSFVVRRKQADSANVRMHFCDNECKASYQKLSKPVTREWIEDHYLNKRMDCVQIGHLVNRDPKSVWNWLKDFGIPTRGRGTVRNDRGSVRPKGRKLTEAHKDAIRQARKRDGRIPAYINGVHWMKATGRKPASWKGGITPERQAFYATQEWKDAVVSVWRRDNARCRRCGLDHRTIDRNITKFHVHHIDSFQVVDRRSDVGNLVLLCDKCHRWVHGKSNKERLYLGTGH